MLKNITYLLIFSGLFLIIWRNTSLRENFYQWQFDLRFPQKTITSQQDIYNILSSFEKVPFHQLQQDYILKTKYNVSKYKKLVNTSNFLKINGKDIFKKIVGDFRIKDFLPKDDFYYKNLNSYPSGEELLWLIDKKLLTKLLALQNALKKEGWNHAGFEVVNGHRHPAYNEKVGGATLSRHLRGQALDIHIRDINNDGKANQEDKKIVLDLLENKIIKSEGGIGRYPGTMSVHFDVRGYRARWDQQ